MDYRKCDFLYRPVLASTSDFVKKTVAQVPFPVFVCMSASAQTSGRGRTGRSFVSEKGGIYFSFSVPLSGKNENIPFLTQVAGLTVCESLREMSGLDIRIKWPNDLILGGRKICGILTELYSRGGENTAICGIGINNRKTVFPPELSEKAGCLEDFSFIIEDPVAFIEKTVGDIYSAVYDGGALSGGGVFTGRLNALSCTLGKTVAAGAVMGTALEICPDGSLKIFAGGKTQHIYSGEINYINKEGK